MKKELEDKLKSDYPNLYSKLDTFQCSDGWYGLIKSLSQIIDSHCHSLSPELKNQIQAVQVKEKFGSLRYYTNHVTPYISGAISMAETMSSMICEHCGDRGSIRSVKGYYFIGCQNHFEEVFSKRV